MKDLQKKNMEGLEPQDAAMLAFATKLNSQPNTIGEADIGVLKTAGFNDDEIKDIIMVVAVFNLYNRFTLGFGLPPEEDLVAARQAAEARLEAQREQGE